jgi:hypothetical protein
MKHKPKYTIFKSVRSWRTGNQFYTRYQLRSTDVLVVTLRSGRMDAEDDRI